MSWPVNRQVLACASPPALGNRPAPVERARALAHSKTRPRPAQHLQGPKPVRRSETNPASSRQLAWRRIQETLLSVMMLALLAEVGALAQTDTNAVTLTIVQPDGTPAPGARVLFGSGPMVSPRSGLEFITIAPNREAATGDDGSCAIILKDHYRVLAMHRSGFAARLASAVRPKLRIQLEPWARVEGVVRAGGEPLAGEQLVVKAPIHFLGRGSYTGWNLDSGAVTDSQGRFALTNLPPGDYLLSRIPQRVRRSSGATSHRWPFALRAGETQRIDYTFGGRTVVGRAEAADLVDWQNDWHYLLKKIAADVREHWPGSESMSRDEILQASAAYAISPEHLAIEREFQTCQLVFDGDGNFRARDVPPGTYELRLRLTRPPSSAQGPSSPREDLGGLTNTVTIPPGPAREPFDLGTIEVPLRSGPAPKPPLSFKATRLDGGEFDTETVRGRPVVLVFWADWAPTATAWLRDLHAWRGALTNADRVTWASVNLGDPEATARGGIAALSTGWTHTQLSGETLVEAAEKIGLHTVPATFLLDASGRVIARDPDLPRLRGNLQRILQTVKP